MHFHTILKFKILFIIGAIGYLFGASSHAFALDWPDLQHPWRSHICTSEFGRKWDHADYDRRIRERQNQILELARAEGHAMPHLRGLMAAENVGRRIRSELNEQIMDYALMASLGVRGEPTSPAAIREMRHVSMIAEKVCRQAIKDRKLDYKAAQIALVRCRDYHLIADNSSAFISLVSRLVTAMQLGEKRKQFDRLVAAAKPVTSGGTSKAKRNTIRFDQDPVQETTIRLMRKNFIEDCSNGIF